MPWAAAGATPHSIDIIPSTRPHTRWTDGNLAGERVLWAAAAGRGRSARLGPECGFYRAGLQRTPAGAPGQTTAHSARLGSPVRRKAERERRGGRCGWT